jgi:mRNA interferase RelE/StbE
MAFRIQYTTRARKDLQHLPRDIAQKIILSLSALKTDPYSCVKKLAGSHRFPLYTHRTGEYRGILSIQNDVLLILVLENGDRKNVYRKY